MGEELKEIVEEQELAVDESAESAETEQQDDSTEEEKVNKDEYIPKNVALQWKKELKEIKKQLGQYKEKEIKAENKARIEDIKQKAIARGYDKDFADLFGELANDLFSSIKKDDPLEEEVAEELEDLESDYPGIKKNKKDIVEKLKKYRQVDPDFTVEDAVKLVGAKPKKRSEKEIELEVEQRQLLARRENGTQPKPSSSGQVKEQYNLSNDDLRVLKGLQEHHPDAGWNKKKFYELMIKNKRR